jgi:hypothetical protein
MKTFLLYLFLIVISNPYEGINYNEINSYDVNYCSDYCYNQNDSETYQEFQEEEEVDEFEYEHLQSPKDRDQRHFIFRN